MFIYWGWDCALSVNEETKDSARTPGRAAVMATLMLVAIFAVISTAALAYAGPAFLAAHSTDWPAASSYSSFAGIGGIFLIGAGSLVIGVVIMLITARFLPRYFSHGITSPAKTERSTSL